MLALTMCLMAMPADHCGQVRAVAVPVTPVVAVPLVTYRVGAPIDQQQLAAQVAAIVLAELERRGQVPAGQPTEPPAEQPEATALELSTQRAQAVANDRCISCHAGQADRIDLRNLAALNADQAGAIFAQIYRGKMPKDGPPLEDTEAAAFLDFMVSKGESEQ